MEGFSKSFDVVGSVAVVETPEKAKKKELREFAGEIMATHPRVRTVARKAGATGGAFRVRPLQVIAGEKSLKTLHKENGCSYEVDLRKVYFQPRLSFERNRVAMLVKEGENVLVLFAGVGPFAINIARQQKTARVVGVEINPVAAKLFKKNVLLNKVNVKVFCEDAKKFLRRKAFLKWAHRIVMPHPTAAFKFLPAALKACKKKATIHFYAIIENNSVAAAEKEIKKICRKKSVSAKIVLYRRALSYSPHAHQAVFDVLVKKK